MALTIKPTRLTDEARAVINQSPLSEAALARAFGVTEKALTDALGGSPTVELIAGIHRATGMPINKIAVFTAIPARSKK